MSTFTFKMLVNGGLVNEKTILTRKGQPFKITNEKELCVFVYRQWKNQTRSKSFQDWADELNQDENFEDAGFTKMDALDNLSSTMIVNVKNKAINLYDYFQKYYPESLA
jgi:hypothetical protein